MDNKIIRIPHELFALSESSRFEGSYQSDPLVLGADEYAFTKPLSYRVDVTNVGGAFLVQGNVFASVSTQCARCLDPAYGEYIGDIEGYFLIDGESAAPEDMEGDEYEYLNEEHTIDLEPLIRAALIMVLPQRPLCKEDCKGLCFECGANLNHETCECNKQIHLVEEPSQPSRFDALKNYKFE